MKWLLLAIIMCGCKTMQPPVYQYRVEAQYIRYEKENGIYVMRFWSKKFDTIYVTQAVKPHFRFRSYATLAWNCPDPTVKCYDPVNVQIFKSR